MVWDGPQIPPASCGEIAGGVLAAVFFCRRDPLVHTLASTAAAIDRSLLNKG